MPRKWHFFCMGQGMKHYHFLWPLLLILAGCASKPRVLVPELPQTYLYPASFAELTAWNDEPHGALFETFRRNCVTGSARAIYGEICDAARSAENPDTFLREHLVPYRIATPKGETTGLMTGYYEAQVRGSMIRDDRYRYPLYGVPDDLVRVELGTLYPELGAMRLRGRMDGERVIPYFDRSRIAEAGAPVICWVDDPLALFLLEVQGSGRVLFDDGHVMQVGYADQNGYPYRSIGKYLVARGEIKGSDVSVGAIRKWFDAHPDRVQATLNHNRRVIFFRQREHGVKGSLGLELDPGRSVAVDRSYIPLGAMLYLRAENRYPKRHIEGTVFAQDTGSAIKGPLRLDYFYGFGDGAAERAGNTMADTQIWILLPKNRVKSAP
jgi:membrane-bound lytic murein transglycosylase A